MATARYNEYGDGDIELARVVGAESERGLGVVPFARTVSNIPQGTVVRGTNPVPPQQQTNNPRNGAQTGNANNDSGGAFAGCVFMMVFVGIVTVVTTTDDGSSSSSRSSPTPFPTRAPTRNPTMLPTVQTDVCPTVFVGGVRQDEFTCSESGCAGSVSWCGLNDTATYQVEVAIRGDYNSANEFVTLFLDGAEIVGSAVDQCGIAFITIANQFVSPVSGFLTLGYSNSEEVDDICSGGTAMTMRVTLSEL